jgi:peptidoglycan hydrolase-like protein with peptidoglycan-binding domain
MANPWDNDPVIDGNPWDNDPVVGQEDSGAKQMSAKSRDLSEGRGLAAISPIAGLVSMALTQFGGGKPDASQAANNPVLNAYRGAVPEGARKQATGFMAGVPSGVTFGWDDEIAGLAGGEAKDQVRAMKAQARQDAPVATVAGEVAGGIVSPVNKVLLPAKGVVAIRTLAQGALEGAKVGAKAGALYGAGEAVGGLDDRAAGAAWGAVIGGLIGAPLGAVGQGISNKVQTGTVLKKTGSDAVLDTARQDLGVKNSSVAALKAVLNRSGYSGDDIDRGIVRIANRQQGAAGSGDRASLFALELQKEFPAAQQNIQDVFQQLMTAPPRQGQSARILQTAVDNQYGSQRTHFDTVAQQKLGSGTVDMEQKILARQRGEIGEIRDRVIKFAATDARGKGVQKKMLTWLDDFADDREVMGSMRAAARELGSSGKNEIADAASKNPALLMQKFGEISGAQLRTARGGSPVLQRARLESESMFDDLSRYTRQEGNVAFAPKDTGKVGPYKRQQAKFSENYSQADAIADARGRFAQARDPVKADEFVNWVNSLPEGEKSLAKTVIRQDMEKMLRGGNIDQDGAYLTNLKKEGVHDVLVRLFGDDGKKISRAISQLVDEQKGLTALDPRKGLQERVVRGPSADRARNLYTTNPIAKLGDKLPAASQLADVGLMASGQLPYVTMAKQGSKLFRPRAATREGLAQLLAMQKAPGAASANRGTLSRIPRTGGASAPASNALATKKPSATQTNPWQPVRLPDAKAAPVAAMDTGARQTVARAEQKLQQARQKMANAKAARADEETVRKLLVDQKQAEAAADLAQQQAKAAKRITKGVLKKINTRARELAKENKTSIASERAKLEQRELVRLDAVAAKQDANRAAGELSSAMESHKQKLSGAKDAADAIEMRTKAESLRVSGDKTALAKIEKTKIKQAAEASRTGVDPADIYDETGVVALNFGKSDDVVVLDAKDYAKTMAKLQKDILRVKHSGHHTPETQLLEDAFGWSAVRRAAEDGRISGWTTAAERKASLRGKQAIGAGVAIGAGAMAYGKYDDNKQARREKAFEAMEQNRDVTKLVQKALKSSGYYKGRNDGKFDANVSNALITFQRSQGISKPGTLNMKTTKALQNALSEAGKTEEAKALKAATPK